MPSWDRRSSSAQATLRDRLVREQVRDVVAPFSPYWKERFAQIGMKAASITGLRDLDKIPAAGERDVCPDGDPSQAARLVVQASETGYALHAPGPSLRKALLRRTVDLDSYRRQVEADSRATTYLFDGLAFRFPIASTRSDLDLVARAGARLWQVLGLTRADVVVSALAPTPTAAVRGLELAAMGAGSPLLAPGDDLDDVAAALRLVPATVLAVSAATAAQVLDDLDEAAAPLATLRTVLLVGGAYDDERAAAQDALRRVGAAADCVVLTAHVADGHRLLWGECRESAGRTGLHTYPDLEVVQLVDPETGEAATGAGLAEVVVTQLGFRGSALLRWRTGDLAESVTSDACPSCGRTVPRVTGLRPGALVPPLQLRDGSRSVDLRGVAGPVVGRADLDDWRIVVARSQRDGADE